MHIAIVSPYDPRPAEDADPQGLRGGVEGLPEIRRVAPFSDPKALRGGVEEALDRCASGLVARGHDVTIVCSAPRAGNSLDPDGVALKRVRRRGAVFRAPIAALWREIPDDADLVHVPATYPGVSDLVPWRERRRGRPVVVDHHFDVASTSAPMRAAAALHHATLARGALHARRVVCKSLDYARHSPALARVPADRLDVVPNGVELDAFPLATGARRDILCVGRLVPYKGVDTLLRAMRAIHDATGACLTVVGDGPEKERLVQLAHDRHVPVHFRGRAPREELPKLYGAHALTVLPSANGQEAFGIALLESMSTGTPVVASELPGVREVAKLAGATARPRDPGDLARAVISALRDPRAFGSPSEIRARVEERYAWPRVIDQLEAVYAKAVAE